MRCRTSRRSCASGTCSEQHQLTEQIFALVRGLLEQKRLLLKTGTIVDATIIEAPPSTKNEAKARDPEMKQGKKGNELALRHEGARRHRQARHRAQPGRPRGNARTSTRCRSCCTARSGRSTATRPTGASCTGRGPQARDPLPREPSPQPRRPLTPQRRLNRLRSATRARGEHAFHVVKTSVGLHQGALPRPGQEHGAALYRLCAGQPVPAQTTVDHATGNVSLVSKQKAERTENTGPKRLRCCAFPPLA